MSAAAPSAGLGPRRVAAAVLTILVLTPVMASAQLSWRLVEHELRMRRYAVLAPAAPASERPLVLLLHGGGGSIDDLWGQVHTRRWADLAGEHGFVLALPEGIAARDDDEAHYWNDCRLDRYRPHLLRYADDVGYLLAVVHDIARTWPVDRDRVYAVGVSNGGMMAYRLGQEARSAFAAVAAVTANLPTPSECRPCGLALPVLVMNGTYDPLMPYEGGCVVDCSRGRVVSTDETVAYWRGLAPRLPDEPRQTPLPDLVAGDHSTVTVLEWTLDGVPWVVLYRVDGGGHAVPGPWQVPQDQHFDIGWRNQDIDAPAEIWAFLERHRHRWPVVSTEVADR